MPFIVFTTNQKINPQQADKIKAETGSLITILHKKEEVLMVQIDDDQKMYLGGLETPCMMIQVKVFHEIDFELKKEFTEKLMKMIAAETPIELNHIKLSFDEYEIWGKNGTLNR